MKYEYTRWYIADEQAERYPMGMLILTVNPQRAIRQIARRERIRRPSP